MRPPSRPDQPQTEPAPNRLAPSGQPAAMVAAQGRSAAHAPRPLSGRARRARTRRTLLPRSSRGRAGVPGRRPRPRRRDGLSRCGRRHAEDRPPSRLDGNPGAGGRRLQARGLGPGPGLGHRRERPPAERARPAGRRPTGPAPGPGDRARPRRPGASTRGRSGRAPATRRRRRPRPDRRSGGPGAPARAGLESRRRTSRAECTGPKPLRTARPGPDRRRAAPRTRPLGAQPSAGAAAALARAARSAQASIKALNGSASSWSRPSSIILR